MQPAEASLIEYCQLIRTATLRTRAEGFTYSSMEDFLLDRARFWTPAPLPARVRPMAPKHCFWNALKLVQRRPRTLRYVEGLATGVIPVHHAWAVDRDGRVLDPTWETPGEAYFGVAFEVGERLLAKGPVLADYLRGFPVFRWPRLKGADDGSRSVVRAVGEDVRGVPQGC